MSMLLRFILIATLAASTTAQRDELSRMQRGSLLDLTRQRIPKRQKEPFGAINIEGGVIIDGPKTPPSPLRIRLLWLNKKTYEYGEKLVYEVSITNTSNSTVTIPWLPTRWLSEPTPGPNNIPTRTPNSAWAYLNLVFHSSEIPNTVTGVHILFGSPGEHRSLKKLRPGQTVRIRAPGDTRMGQTGEQRSRIYASLPSRLEVRAQFKVSRRRPPGRTLGAGGIQDELPAVSVNSITVEIDRRPPR